MEPTRLNLPGKAGEPVCLDWESDRVYWLSGQAGAGRTTSLLGVASDFVRQGGEVFAYDSQGTLGSVPGVRVETDQERFMDVLAEATASRVASHGSEVPLLLLVDDAWTFDSEMRYAFGFAARHASTFNCWVMLVNQSGTFERATAGPEERHLARLSPRSLFWYTAPGRRYISSEP